MDEVAAARATAGRKRSVVEVAPDNFAEVNSGGCEGTVSEVSLGRPRGGATLEKRLEDEIGVEVGMLGPSSRRESRRSSRRQSPGGPSESSRR